MQKEELGGPGCEADWQQLPLLSLLSLTTHTLSPAASLVITSSTVSSVTLYTPVNLSNARPWNM